MALPSPEHAACLLHAALLEVIYSGREGLTKMPSHDARLKSSVDEAVSPKVWLLTTIGESVMDRVSAPTCPSTMPLLYVMVKDASDPCRDRLHMYRY